MTRTLPHAWGLPLAAVLAVTGVALGQVELTGRVIHAETGSPIAGAAVYLSAPTAPRRTAFSDDRGLFRIPIAGPGTYELTVSAVGFGLMRRTVTLRAEPQELEVLLSPGTRLHEELTVVAAAPAAGANLPAGDLHQLKTVLLDDAVRALAHLPALATGDDFNTGFAFQGSGFDRVGVFLDGVPVYSLTHTILGLEDTGSTTLLSADLLADLELNSPAAATTQGAFSGGTLSMSSRTGNRDRWRNSVSVSGTALSGITEGPVGSGSWILSGRKSYVDWLVRKIDPEADAGFGFHDVFGKLTQDLGRRHQVAVSLIAGRTGVQDLVEGSSLTAIDRGRFSTAVLHGEWLWSARSWLTGRTHLYIQSARGRNRNRLGVLRWSLDENVTGVRTEWAVQTGRRWSLSGGAGVEGWTAAQRGPGGILAEEGPVPVPTDYREHPRRTEYFLEGRLQPVPAVTLTAAGGRRRQTDGGSFLNARFAAEVRTRVWRLTAGWGQSGQFAFFNQLYGPFGNRHLDPERARVLETRLRWSLGETAWLEGGAYRRSRAQVPWRVEGGWRIVGGVLVPPSVEPYGNHLQDRSHGFDLRAGFRDGPWQGWAGYAWSRSRWSEAPGQWFPGNYDQRHAFSMLVHYRTGAAFEFALKGKFSGGVPLPLYAELRDGRYFAAADRNQVRLPAYGRLDVRGAKTFDRDSFRLSLFVEVLNVLGRKNYRFAGLEADDVDPWTGRLYGVTSKQLPWLPTAGLVFEW